VGPAAIAVLVLVVDASVSEVFVHYRLTVHRYAAVVALLSDALALVIVIGAFQNDASITFVHLIAHAANMPRVTEL
jgi:hypothetical protein